ncbi:hypothetical protein G3N57_31150 [Paraburkholderia sp. Se-20369]|nr:hypothetical protein [Paraburkholderia sp. Se-20369]
MTIKQTVRVISVRYWCDQKPPRATGATLRKYAESLQQTLSGHFYQAVTSAFEAIRKASPTNTFRQDTPSGEKPLVTFVTAPEFYWNVPWSALHDMRDVHQLVDLQIDPVRHAIAAIADRFPVDRFGPIVFLPGTVAMLFKTEQAADTTDDGTIVGPYESLNYTLATTNFLPPLDTGRDASLRRTAAWPKRNTSWIDYGDALRTVGGLHTFAIAGKQVEVRETSVIAPQSTTSTHDPLSRYAGPRLSDSFDNRLGDAPPFGIDICRDYLLWRKHPSNDVKAPYLDDDGFAIDFVPSYGVPVSTLAFTVPDTLQYIVHNNGQHDKAVAVIKVDRKKTHWSLVPEAGSVRHLSNAQRERVAIHEFDVDRPDAGGAQ